MSRNDLVNKNWLASSFRNFRKRNDSPENLGKSHLQISQELQEFIYFRFLPKVLSFSATVDDSGLLHYKRKIDGVETGDQFTHQCFISEEFLGINTTSSMNIQKKNKKTVRSSQVKNVTQFKQSVNEPESSQKSFCPLEGRFLDF